MLSSRMTPFTRRISALRRHHIHSAARHTGLLPQYGLRLALQRGRWPLGVNSLHNVPAVRSISFARAIPKFFLKAARIPAAFGGVMIATVAYVQYQAMQAGNYAIDMFNRAKETASDAASTALASASGSLGQTKAGWDKTVESVRSSTWFHTVFGEAGQDGAGEGSRGTRSSGGNGGPSGGSQQSRTGAVGGATAGAAAAFAYDTKSTDGDDTSVEEQIARDDQMMTLTRKMIEIRSLLQSIGQSETLTLPSIVVVGSQSSGKSSVLEAIVGHEFLPKGSNMVTRRPIELTLVNTPDTKAEYGEFPTMGLGKITDFSQIQRTLTDLNLSVSDKDCVSDDPIQLRICSPNVPDLSLIDLPGYIQVTAAGQPPELKEKISQLCEKYIKAPNVILAISAADVDLANSTALRASRRVDPRGERTIGVITKMDLVDPQRASSLLTDKNYALRLGYVGVVARVPQQTTGKLFSRGGGSITKAITKNENAYFSAHPQEFGPESHVNVGVMSLRKQLMHVLEQTMSSRLAIISESVRAELSEATYEYKVQYNERPLRAETYLAESLDAFKHSFKTFTQEFGRDQIRLLLKQELDQQVLNLMAQRYWNKPLDGLAPGTPDFESLSQLPKSDPEDDLWRLKLDASTASLTKLGVGRLATSVVADALQHKVGAIVNGSNFAAHPFAHRTITDAAASIIRGLSYDTSDELEICLKPYKFRIELDAAEWTKARKNITTVLQEELRVCEAALKKMECDAGGRKKLKDVMSFIDKVRSGQIVLEGNGAGGAGGFSSALLERGREAIFLRDRAGILNMRVLAVKSKKCSNKDNKYYCPEVFLDAVADKLINTADLFLDAELLSKFYYNFPRELDFRLGRGLSQTEVERFAREDPKIRRHLDLVRRKELLEHVLKETESLRQLEVREKRYGRSRLGSKESPRERESGRSWGLF